MKQWFEHYRLCRRAKEKARWRVKGRERERELQLGYCGTRRDLLAFGSDVNSSGIDADVLPFVKHTLSLSLSFDKGQCRRVSLSLPHSKALKPRVVDSFFFTLFFLDPTDTTTVH